MKLSHQKYMKKDKITSIAITPFLSSANNVNTGWKDI